MGDLLLSESIGNMHKVFVTCSGCGKRDQIAPYRMIVHQHRSWRAIFPKLRCVERPNACGAHASKLEVFSGTGRPLLERVR